jgi:hypothetical protein
MKIGEMMEVDEGIFMVKRDEKTSNVGFYIDYSKN